MIGFLPD